MGIFTPTELDTEFWYTRTLMYLQAKAEADRDANQPGGAELARKVANDEIME